MSELGSEKHVSRREQRIDRAFRRSLVVIAGMVAIVIAVAVWLGRPESSGEIRQTEISLPEIDAVGSSNSRMRLSRDRARAISTSCIWATDSR